MIATCGGFREKEFNQNGTTATTLHGLARTPPIEPLRAKVDHKVMPYDPHMIGGISGVLKSYPMM